jgi:hypothetical protein
MVITDSHRIRSLTFFVVLRNKLHLVHVYSNVVLYWIRAPLFFQETFFTWIRATEFQDFLWNDKSGIRATQEWISFKEKNKINCSRFLSSRFPMKCLVNWIRALKEIISFFKKVCLMDKIICSWGLLPTGRPIWKTLNFSAESVIVVKFSVILKVLSCRWSTCGVKIS